MTVKQNANEINKFMEGTKSCDTITQADSRVWMYN